MEGRGRETRKFSYKEKVVGPPVEESTMVDWCEEEYSSEEELESDEEEDCPTIRVSAEDKTKKRRMRLPWRKLLIIKCLGKRLGYNFMVRRLSGN